MPVRLTVPFDEIGVLPEDAMTAYQLVATEYQDGLDGHVIGCQLMPASLFFLFADIPWPFETADEFAIKIKSQLREIVRPIAQTLH